MERLNLDAASFRQLERTHDGDGDAVRAAVLDIVASRGKMQNPETGSGGMLVGTVEEVGPESPLGLAVGDRVTTLVSLTLTPLVIEDGLARWDGRSRAGALRRLRRSSSAARSPRCIPDDLPAELSLAVMDVCGAPALTARRGGRVRRPSARPRSSSPSSAAPASRARCPWPPPRPPAPRRTIGVVPHQAEADLLTEAGSPTWSRSPTPATRSPSPRPCERPGDRPT